MLCSDIEDWDDGSGRKSEEGGYIYIYIHIHIADSLHCTVAANAIL